MHCIILSAGKNSRLDTGVPKSLLELDGISLLERHIKNFHALGVNNFCVVTGHNPSRIQETVPQLAAKYSVEIDLVHNDRYDLENGYSVHSAKSWIKESKADHFYLTMGDHFFNPNLIRTFIELSQKSAAALQLAVDPPGSGNQHIDLEDVTKVFSGEEGHIVDIGKHLTHYNYFDTGLFCLSATIFDVLSACFEVKEFTISHMVKRLALKKEAKVVPVPGYFWNDIDNPLDLKNTKELMDTLN